MVNSNSITDLYPPMQRAAAELLRRMEDMGHHLGLSSTYRDFESQDALYKHGRDIPGRIITNARGGESFHNYGLAFDVYYHITGSVHYKAILTLAGHMGQELGLEWGGNWETLVDMPHFQWSGGLTIRELQQGKMPPDDPWPWEKARKSSNNA